MIFWDTRVINLMKKIEKYIKLIKKDKELRFWVKAFNLYWDYKLYKEKYNEAKEAYKQSKVVSDRQYRNKVANNIQIDFLDKVAKERYKDQIYKLNM